MKNLTIIYCGEDSEAAIALAKSLRMDTDNKVLMTSTEFFHGPDPEAQRVIIMPDIPEHRAQIVRDAYPASMIGVNSEIVPEKVMAFFEGAKRGPGRPRKVAV